jgi:hypothetical protein
MKRALLMGLNSAGTPDELKGCINDVANIKALLLTNQYAESNITVLTDNGQLPTRAAIMNELFKLTTLPSSELFIYYSGHGSRIKDLNQDEKSGMDSVLVPCDFETSGFILDDYLLVILSKLRCKTTLLFDSCNSGTVCDLPYSLTYTRGRLIQDSTRRIAKLSNPLIYMISGCKDDQESIDTYADGNYCGAFTHAFLKSLDSKKSILDMYVETCKKMSESQTPVLSTSAPLIRQAVPLKKEIPLHPLTKSLPYAPLTRSVPLVPLKRNPIKGTKRTFNFL